METLRCQCASCDSDLADFVNLWVQIGKGYCSPVIEADIVKLDAKGPQRDGESGTLVADCLLQDLVCIKCQSNVGLKCVASPVNHVLHDNQILLRRAAVKLRAPRARKESELNIQRSLKLRQPVTSKTQQPTTTTTTTTTTTATTTPPGDRNRNPQDNAHAGATESGAHFHEAYASVSAAAASLELGRLQADLDTQRADIDRIDSAAYQVVSSFDNSVSRIDRELHKLNDTIQHLRRDLEANKAELPPLKTDLSALRDNVPDSKAVLAKLESQMEATNAAVAAMRKLTSGTKTAADHLHADLQGTTRQVRDLRTETSALREELDTARKTAKDALAASNDHARQFALLQAELRQMRDVMAQDRARRPDPPKPDYPTNELDIITANVSKIGRETGQVSSLQMEFDLFKSRMKRLERRVDVCEEKKRANETQGGLDIRDDRDPPGRASGGEEEDDHHHWFPPEGARKRRAAGTKDPGTTGANLETPPKRMAHPRDDVRPSIASSPLDIPLSQAASGRNRTVSSSSSSSSSINRQANSRRQTMAGVRGKSTAKRKSRGAVDALDAIYTPPGD